MNVFSNSFVLGDLFFKTLNLSFFCKNSIIILIYKILLFASFRIDFKQCLHYEIGYQFPITARKSKVFILHKNIKSLSKSVDHLKQ